MGTTANYAFPYPELTDAPDGPAQIKALADAVDSEITTLATVTRTSYTPNCYTAMNTTPAPLARTVTYAYYWKLTAKIILAKFNVTVSASSSSGFGIDLPFTASFRDLMAGNMSAFGTSPPTQAGIARTDSSLTKLVMVTYSNIFVDVASGQAVEGSVIYETA